MRTFIDTMYRAEADIDRLVASIEVGDDQAKLAAAAAEVSLDDQAPIIQLVNRIVVQALRDRASDVHIEPTDGRVRIECVEDIFGLPSASYVSPTPTSWVSPLTSPAQVPYRRLGEAPWWTVVKRVATE